MLYIVSRVRALIGNLACLIIDWDSKEEKSGYASERCNISYDLLSRSFAIGALIFLAMAIQYSDFSVFRI